MSTLKDQITSDMKQSMRARDKVRLESIRLLRAGIQRREIDEKIDLDDTQVLVVIQKMIKQGKDSIALFDQGGREDLVQKEAATLAVLEIYLPEQLDEEALLVLIEKAVSESGAETVRDMGKVMGLLKPQVQGQADMGVVSGLIKQKLSN